ncbi:hypothetical protein NPIL_77521 [Nephila pilipes]|uniref:Uncharacterized protein n=1 Tax=Nephila pilipes TaxID=299642 RepID=A0A8X6N1R8_NEPPI|nr:hypothetical protein NPIL_77521 [Nephila pilipes]
MDQGSKRRQHSDVNSDKLHWALPEGRGESPATSYHPRTIRPSYYPEYELKSYAIAPQTMMSRSRAFHSRCWIESVPTGTPQSYAATLIGETED